MSAMLSIFQYLQRCKVNETTPVLACFCIQSSGSISQPFRVCALCSLPLFLMVTVSSPKPPLTPFEAASCGGDTALKRHSGPRQSRNIKKLDQTWVDLSDSGSLTTAGCAGASLVGGSWISLDMREVKSRLGLTAFASGEPRSAGWSVLVRLMVLWLLNGREGGCLSQSASRRRNGKNK